jgi:Family of unknown function (DUF5946)
MTSDLVPCPGCGALFPAIDDGPTHPYIGASAGCWALFAALSSGAEPDPELIATTRVTVDVSPATPDGETSRYRTLLVDAYAAQHHGDDSAPAIHSVGVHLIALYGVLAGSVPVERVLWLRRHVSIGQKKDFHRLEPPALGSMLTLRHLYAGGGVDARCSIDAYVESVYRGWMALHGSTVHAWYERCIERE